MKKIIAIIMIMALMGFAAGCSSSGDAAGSGSNGAKTETGSDAADASGSDNSAEGAADTSGSESTADASGADNAAEGAADTSGTESDADPSVDVDLTALSSTMVYAQVYDMMSQPEKFMDKKVKMSGPFAVYTDEATKKNYFACIIQDATACCSQGLEFELAGKHDYPADYPKQGDEITVVGTFGTYEEAGSTYCTLRNAKFA